MANPLLTDPDLLGALIEALNDRMAVPVVNAVPNPRPGSFVRLDLLGGAGRATVTTRCTITYEAWAATAPAAHTLAADTAANLHQLGASQVGDVLIYRVDDIAAPGNLPDPESHQSRMVGTVEVTVRLAGA